MESGKFRYSADQMEALRAALLAGPGTIDRDDADDILQTLERRADGYIVDVNESAALPDKKHLLAGVNAEEKRLRALIAELETVELFGDADLIGLADSGPWRLTAMFLDEEIGPADLERLMALNYLRSKLAWPSSDSPLHSLWAKDDRQRKFRKMLIAGAMHNWCEAHGLKRENLSFDIDGKAGGKGPGGKLCNFLVAACGPAMKRAGQDIDLYQLRNIFRSIKAEANSAPSAVRR